MKELERFRIVCGIILSFIGQAHAQDFRYTTNNGAITITKYNGSGGVVKIPGTITGLPVTSIGDFAFDWDTRPMSVIIPNSVTNIGYSAFWLCTGLTNVTLGTNVTTIGECAFSACTNLTTVSLPNSVTTIQRGAFSGCIKLTSIQIPENVVSIGYSPFGRCSGLTNITVSSLNGFYGSVDGLLLDKSQTRVLLCPEGRSGSYTVPNTVTSIEYAAFLNCTKLSNVIIGIGVTNLGITAFGGCSGLTNVTLGPTITFIDYWAFSCCSNLTSLSIPDSVTTIQGRAFELCVGLRSVSIGKGATEIPWDAFRGCTNLMGFSVDAGNPVFSSNGGIIFDKSQNTLLVYPNGRAGDYTVPKSVTSIYYSAFCGCIGLTSISMGANVTNIEGGAFSQCNALTNVTLPEGISIIHPSTFQGCASLSRVALPSTVTAIGVAAFGECRSLKSVTFPKGVTSIWADAFSGCSNLRSVYFTGDAPADDFGDVFSGTLIQVIYYLPGTSGWKATFAGHPTALWNPQVQTNLADFGVQANRFGFGIAGTSNLVLVVEASTNLARPAWFPVSTNTLTGGTAYFSDPDWTNFPTRFYRLRSP